MSTMPDRRPRPTLGWRIRHSWWLLLPIFGLGCLNGLGFIYIGLRARRADWWIPGIVYLVAGPAFFLFASNETPEQEPNSWWAMGWFAVWVASLAHACLVNSAWLRWRAGYVPWHAQPPAAIYGGAAYPPPGGVGHPGMGEAGYPGLPPGPPGPVVLPAGLAPPPSHYYGPGPAASAVPPAPPPGAGATPAGAAPDAAPPDTPVDVNTAGPEQLAALPGFDPERVRRVLAEREVRRGFGSVEEFAAAAHLPPHEFVRVRGLVVCAPSPLEPPPPGRILDV